tara:strand:+ start:89 stop:226 length:138 start_codon:yes stop_codon:yes gene_type:complete
MIFFDKAMRALYFECANVRNYLGMLAECPSTALRVNVRGGSGILF